MPIPSDFLVVQGPRAQDYRAPLIDFSPIANLPNDYYNAQQQARTRALQNAFPNGLPRAQDGSLDVNAIGDTLARLGGAESVSGLLPQLQKLSIGQGNAALINEGTGQGYTTTLGPDTPSPGAPVNRSPSASTAAGSPDSIMGPGKGAAYSTAQPQLSSFGADNSGTDTLRSLATEIFGGQDASGLIRSYSQQPRTNPDAPLTSSQAQAFTTFAGRYKLATGMRQQQVTGSGQIPSGGEISGSSNNEDPSASGAPPGEVTPNDVAMNGRNAVATGQGANGSPAPTGLPSAAQALAGAGQDPMGTVQRLQRAAQTQMSRASAIADVDPQGAATLRSNAEMLNGRANMILEGIKGDTERAAALKTKAIGNVIDQSQKTYNGLQGASSQFERDQKPYLTVARSLLSSPELYTGAGGAVSLNFNRIKAEVGAGDPKAAMLQEALQKVTASSVLAQMNMQRDQMAEAGSQSGRIFSSQVDQIEKAAPQMATTLGGNRFLVEVQSRMGELSTQVAGMARNWLRTHDYLGPEFDQQVSNYLKRNPLFSKQELSHPDLLGAPTLPPEQGSTPQAAHAWGAALGLKPGDPVRTTDGRIIALP
jgi:hypothetical protein